MKILARCAISVWTVMALAFASAAAEHRTTLTIRSDGTSLLTVDKAESRLLAEQQVRLWERYQKQAAMENDDQAPPATSQETKPFTDEELAKMLRAQAQFRAEQMGEESGEKLEVVEVRSNTVHTVTSRTFGGLEEMLQQSYAVWGQAGLAFDNVKFEKDADGRLRVTFTPSTGRQRYVKNLRQQWKAAGATSEVRMVFPGRVLSSGLPHSQDNATWLVIDAQKNETLDAGVKFYGEPTVIAAELGGLKVDQALESKTLQRMARRGASDLSVTDAGPGFVAEAAAVTTTTLHYFPGGEKALKQAGSFGVQPTGTVVRAKLFAPKDRTLQSVSGVRVLKATDDKGRPIASADKDTADYETQTYYGGGGGNQAGNSISMSLRMELPHPDAQSIDELAGEAIALTAGKWREMTLTNVTATFTNEVDLTDVLPGAKFVITKFTSKNRQTMIQLQLKGPPAIRQIEVQSRRSSGPNRSSTGANERAFTNRGGQATRTLQIQSYAFGNEAEGEASGPLSLLVRYPEDQRRERVRFVLKGLDLL